MTYEDMLKEEIERGAVLETRIGENGRILHLVHPITMAEWLKAMQDEPEEE